MLLQLLHQLGAQLLWPRCRQLLTPRSWLGLRLLLLLLLQQGVGWLLWPPQGPLL